jgi:hypothetical protein
MNGEIAMSTRNTLLILVLLLASATVSADDLTGADKLLCTSVQAARCSLDEDCWTGQPWTWNIPQFIEIDFAKKQLGTTEASGENRVTPIKNLERKDGVIYLQGVEGGRAFSFVIVEATGSLAVAVATEGGTTSVLGACTPR